MTRYRWYALGIACFVIWIILATVLSISVFGLLIGAGFFLGRGKCADEINELNAKVWKYRLRTDQLTELLSTAADRLGDNPIQVETAEVKIESVTIDMDGATVIECDDPSTERDEDENRP